MKKIIFLLTVSLFSLVSCSKDDDVPTAESTDGLVLLHQTITTTSDPMFPDIENYSYDGNHIVKISDNFGDHKDYTYSGDLITKIDHYNIFGLEHTDYFIYNSNNLLLSYKSLYPDPLTTPTTGTGVKEVYVYNTDGTISWTKHSGDLVTQTTLDSYGKINFINDEISSITTNVGSSGSVVQYTYDGSGKKYAMKNVTGWKRISFYTHEATGVKQNIVSEIENSSSGTTTNVTNFTYNTALYPLTSTETLDGVDQGGTTQYIY